MYGLIGLLPASGENVMSTAPLEIYLLREMVMCSILILLIYCNCDISSPWVTTVLLFPKMCLSDNLMFLITLYRS